MQKKKILIQALSGAIILASCGTSFASDGSVALKELMSMDKPARPAKDKITPVRAAILSQAASTLGLQTGLWQGSINIRKALKNKDARLSKAFRFGDMVMSEGVLPPVVTCMNNVEAIKGQVKRIAARVCKIEEPARFFSGAPSWEDYLLLGLPGVEQKPQGPDSAQLLPQNSTEREFWRVEVKKAYEEGEQQALDILLDNLAQLERSYIGMRTFYELYQRKMVSKPQVAKSQDVSTQDDGNTLALGDTLVRITVDAEFLNDPEQWKALLARPSDNKGRLPYTGEFDAAQVAHAMEVAQSLGAWRKEIAQIKSKTKDEKKRKAIKQAVPKVAKKSKAAVVKNPETKAIAVKVTDNVVVDAPKVEKRQPTDDALDKNFAQKPLFGQGAPSNGSSKGLSADPQKPLFSFER